MKSHDKKEQGSRIAANPGFHAIFAIASGDGAANGLDFRLVK